MSKEATVYVVDVSPSMQRLADGKSNFQRANELLLKMLHPKIMSERKTDLVHVVLVGTEASENRIHDEQEGYDHISLYNYDSSDKNFLKMADTDLLKFIANGSQVGTQPADIMGGVIVAMDVLGTQFPKGSVVRKMYVLTDLAEELDMDATEAVAERAKALEISLNVVIFDALQQPSPTNAQGMTDFLKQIHGQMFSFDFAWDILSKPRSKIVKPVTVFRGNLTLGDSSAHPDSTFSVPVHVFNKTSEFKVPSAKKWNARSTAEENAISDHTVAIQREYVYKDVDEDEESESADAQAEDIEKEDLTKSFFFGRRLMPCYADDEEAWKLRTEKEFVMLGFVDMQKVPRHYLMSNVMLVVPEPMNLRGLESFSALLAALREKNYGALIRYCRIRDATPKLGVMVCSPKGQGLFCQIPYKEDLRDYSFSAIDPLLYNDEALVVPEKHLRPDGTRKKLKLDNRQVSSTEAKAALANFVDSMSLSGIISTDDDTKDAYQPKEVFNPLAQRLGTWVQHRVLHPDDKQFPETDPVVMQGITPLPWLLENAEKSIQAVKSAFAIKKVPVKAKGPGRNNAGKTATVLQASDDEELIE